MIAAIILYAGDFAEIFFQSLEFIAAAGGQEGKRRRVFPAVRLLVMMLFAMLPLFLILPLNDYFFRLGENTAVIGAMLILSGIILAISDRLEEGKKAERSMGIYDAIIIGLCQAVSAIPGISRIGTVYTAGIATGHSRAFAARFAVMISVPVILFSNIFRLFHAASASFALADLGPCFAGMAAAIVGGILSIRVFRSLVKNRQFHAVGYYCWVAGVLVIILTMIF